MRIRPRNSTRDVPAKVRCFGRQLPPKVFLVVAALIVTAIVPVSLLYSRSAGASTAACGSACTSPSVESLGTGEVLAVGSTTTTLGVTSTSVVMSAASTSNSAEDWTPEAEGTVGQAAGYGIVSTKLELLYGGDNLFEFQYAPSGVPSNMCMGNTASDYNGLSSLEYYQPTLTVALVKCGITAQSLWIVDQNTLVNSSNGYTDLINAGWESTYTYGNSTTESADSLTSPFAEPAVLTVNSSGSVVLAPLSEIGGVVSPGQMWLAGPEIQSAVRAKAEKAK